MMNMLPNTKGYMLPNNINDIVSTHKGKAQYETIIDILITYCFGECQIADTDISKLREFLCALQSKLNSEYDERCKLFDDAESIDCFNPRYAINTSPTYVDYEKYLIYVLASEVLLFNGDSKGHINSSYFIKKDFVTTTSRFLFLFNGNIKLDYDKEESKHPNIYRLILSHLISIILNTTWAVDELSHLRLLVLNIIDSVGSDNTEELISTINQSVDSLNNRNIQICDETLSIINSSVGKYNEFISNSNTIAEIKTSWLYAYIYKKRFGFILCKKFAKSENSLSLPYKFQAFTFAFKNRGFRQVSNGPKVVLLEAGENKRSSEYIPLEFSFYYNFTSMKFE